MSEQALIMVNIPEFPTDNLYKFKAFIFFVLTVASGVVWSTVLFTDETSEEEHALIMNSILFEQIEFIDKQVININESLFDPNANTLTSSFGHEEKELLKVWKHDLIKEKFELEKQQIYFNGVIDNLNYNNDYKFTFYYWVSFFFIALFLTFTIINFNSWKSNLQIYQDAILMREAGVPDETIREHLSLPAKEVKDRNNRKPRKRKNWNQESRIQANQEKGHQE